MFPNLWRMRLGAVIAGVILTGVYFMGGGPVPGTSAIIQIDYSMYPDDFEGLPVQIDGEIAGHLKRFGNAHRTGFPVRPGRHAVRVLHDQYASRVLVIHTEPGMPAVLILDYQETLTPDGHIQPTLSFQN